jgi:hypothetical protein
VDATFDKLMEMPEGTTDLLGASAVSEAVSQCELQELAALEREAANSIGKP